MFISLTKIDSEHKIVINMAHITSIQPENDDSTWVELSNGNKFLVEELAVDILDALKAKIVGI